MKAIILSAGTGKKIWPYGRYHNKGMLKIGNQPILKHLCESLMEEGIEEIIIAVSHQAGEVYRAFRNDAKVHVVEIAQTRGSAETLKQVMGEERSLVIFGDCWISKEDLHAFLNSDASVLLSSLHQSSTLQICAQVDDQFYLKQFWGHPRGTFTYFAAAFMLDPDIKKYLNTSCIFPTTKVGVGSPEEIYLESSINDYLQDGHGMKCILAAHQIYDIDKPWHLLEANRAYNEWIASHMSKQDIGENTYISKNAKIAAHVRIGKNCLIGDHVVIAEGCVIEDHTKIDNGAIIGKGVHIGAHCVIENYCKIGDYSSVGDECIIGHTAELLEGVLFDKVYLYHYGEFFGVIGTHTDLGAGTTCGTLRFDDGKTMHVVCGHKEIPETYSNACFIGDYSRTGVGAILLPGCKIGSKSVVGSGVILNEDVEDNTLIYPKQELCKVPWGDEKYGW